MSLMTRLLVLVMVGLLLVGIGMNISLRNDVDRIASSVERLTEVLGRMVERTHMVDPGEFRSEWKYQGPSGPLTHEVYLKKDSGESAEDFRTRIRTTMAADLLTYPPI